MNPPIALSIVASVVGLVVALLSLRFGSAPRWTQYRALALVAATAGLYCGLDAFTTARLPAPALVAITHVENAIAALHCAAWLSYVQRRLGGPRALWYRLLRDALVLIAVLWVVPGVALTGEVKSFELPWLGARYDIATANTFGSLMFVALLAVLLLSSVRLLRAANHGFRDARMHAFALGAIGVTAASDSLVASGVLHIPLALSLGFLVAVGALGWALTRDFVTAARELERLSTELETLVAERTKELSVSETARFRAEKMAAVGQLAAGVAHEINNPAAALSANLAYLSDGLAHGKLPGDVAECLEESSEAVARIGKIVAQLLDSSRAAARADRSVSVLAVVHAALASSKTHLGAHITSTSRGVDPSLFVRGDEAALTQVLTNLIVNAAHAIPKNRAGRIELRAAKVGERIRIEVADDGAGMSAETERRIFEPFFTTKAHGEGTGLGLSVSLGLVRSMGGELSLATSDAGTTVSILLDVAPAPAGATAEKSELCAARRRVLLVDDDVVVARAVARALRSRADVETASGVVEAHEMLLARDFDVILSDLQMPAGGGRRLYEELLARSADTARRVVFFSGGSPSAVDAAFIAQERIPLLAKPLVVDELFVLVERIAGPVTRS
jgi:signal transduction histidine kinase/CheY-like chemotaxis protein